MAANAESNGQTSEKQQQAFLNEREMCVLFQVYEKVSLTCSHMLKLCFQGRGIGSVYKVVSRLKKRGCLNAATYDLGRRGKLEDVHTLTKKGWQQLVRAEIIEETTCPFLVKTSPNVLADYVHRMAIIHYWIDLEMDLLKQAQFELTLFVPEFKRLENGKTITLRYETPQGFIWQVRNDALFIITDTLAEREFLFLLEIDRGTIPIQVNDRVRKGLELNTLWRSNLESKLLKIQKLLSVCNEVFTRVSQRLAHFHGARVVVITSSAKRVLNIIHTVPFHPELLKQEVFLFSYFDEVGKGAFLGRYGVAVVRGGEVGTRAIKDVLC